MSNITAKQRETLRRVVKGFSVEIIVAVLIDEYGIDGVFDIILVMLRKYKREIGTTGVSKQKGG